MCVCVCVSMHSDLRSIFYYLLLLFFQRHFALLSNLFIVIFTHFSHFFFILNFFQAPSFIRKLQLGFFGSEISLVAAPNAINFSILNSLLLQIKRLISCRPENTVFLYTMQYCILRVLRSNFVRVQEQLKSADDVGLIYFPLKYPMGVDKGGEGEEGGNPSDLVVFQLLRSIMECISGGLNVLSMFYRL